MYEYKKNKEVQKLSAFYKFLKTIYIQPLHFVNALAIIGVRSVYLYCHLDCDSV